MDAGRDKMSITYYDKAKTNAIKFGPADSWGKTEDAEKKTRTYTAGTDGATIEIKFENGNTQSHASLKAGSKVIVHENGQVEIEEVL